MGDITFETPLFAVLLPMRHGHRLTSAYRSRWLSLPTRPAENSLKMLVCEPVLFICDSD